VKPAKLKFGRANAKLRKWWKKYHLATFSLPAGFTCPGARDCLARVGRHTGKLTDGKHTQFRCYAATAEALFPNIRQGRWANLEKLQACKSPVAMANLIVRSLPKKAKLVRIHQSGDFFSQSYFDAWLIVASILRPQITFYGYTKALPFWIARLDSIPRNLKLVASRGGKFDHLIPVHNLRSALVVYTELAAQSARLQIDHDDSLLFDSDRDFAILLHGTQPAGSIASEAWQEIKTNGSGGYKSDYFAHYAKAGGR
jgi:hypothetical protein